MIRPAITSIPDVVRQHLCTGCGACAGLSPSRFRMADQPDAGRRPVRISDVQDKARDREELALCPGAGAGPRPMPRVKAEVLSLCPVEWGNVIEVWEGHAADEDIRWRGSSGGAVTALAVFALESGAAGGVVHVRQSASDPLFNTSVISRRAYDVASAAGSRYAPASPCDRLSDIAASDTPLVFVGKPCDVQAAAAASRRDDALAKNIALTISIFCAGTPSTNGTRALLSALDVPEGARVTGIKYRGEGWPGEMSASYVGSDGETRQTRGLSYGEGWGQILQKHRQWRCHVCADHTGEFADISVGDPWDRPREIDGGKGTSLIVVRSERGRAFLRSAIAAGVLLAEQRPLRAVADAQPNLARTRRILFGRLLGLRILGLAAPRYTGWKLASLWITRAGMRDRIGSVLGTAKRAIRRRLWKPENGSCGQA